MFKSQRMKTGYPAKEYYCSFVASEISVIARRSYVAI
jgi:hypothetical protein